MHDLDFLVPSALVDPSLAAELLRDQALPNLARIVAHAASVETIALPPDASLTSWQAWVFGTRAGVGVEHVNIAELWMAACGMAPSTKAGRYLAEPAHFRIAKDHLRLDDPRTLAITLAEVRALVDSIEPVLAEAGWRLDPIELATLTHWPLSRDDGVALSGAAIERAIGDNVAAWQPRIIEASTSVGEDVALAWRRCVNEIQMLWFGHPVNEAREANGQPAINTLWLSGNGERRSAQPHYAAVDSGLPLLASLGIEPDAPRALESFDRFIDAERGADWSGWREQLARLDARLAGVIRQQAAKSLGALTLILCGEDAIKVVTIGPRDLAKVWRGWGRKRTLADLFSDNPAG
jgi:hypothetical protein